MPQGAVTITPRLLYLEDMDHTTVKGATTTAYIEGLGDTPVTKVDYISLASLVSAANDAAAASGGVGVGYFYYNTSTNAPKTRMT